MYKRQGYNRIYLHESFAPKYYAIEDDLDIKQFHDDINKYDRVEYKFVPTNYKDLIYGDDVIYVKFLKIGYHNLGSPNFVSKIDKPKFYWGGCVMYFGIQLAYYMGCNPIYIIGADHDWGVYDNMSGTRHVMEGSDKHHFTDKYYGYGKDWFLPQKWRIDIAYTKAKKVLSEKGVKIYNATIGGKIDIFERVNYNELF